jgi:hypothetical protein
MVITFMQLGGGQHSCSLGEANTHAFAWRKQTLKTFVKYRSSVSKTLKCGDFIHTCVQNVTPLRVSDYKSWDTLFLDENVTRIIHKNFICWWSHDLITLEVFICFQKCGNRNPFCLFTLIIDDSAALEISSCHPGRQAPCTGWGARPSMWVSTI